MSENEEDQQSSMEPEAMGEGQTDEEAIAQASGMQVDPKEFTKNEEELEKLAGDDAALTLALEFHDKVVLVHTRALSVGCPFGNVHIQHFWRGYQSGMEWHAAEEESNNRNRPVDMSDLIDSAAKGDVPRLQWHVGHILGVIGASEGARAGMSQASEILRWTARTVGWIERELERVREAATEHRHAYEEQMASMQWVRAAGSQSERLFFFKRLPGVVEIKRLGKRMPHELLALLERGHFVSGNRRITKESEFVAPAAEYVDYILWDDWELQKSCCKATTLMGLIEIQGIPIEEWSWISVPPPADLP